MKVYLTIILLFFSCQSLFSQDLTSASMIQIPMQKHWNDSASTTQSLMRFDKGNVWARTYPVLNDIPTDLDSVSNVSEYMDYGQVVYQAYKRGDMPFSFLNQVIKKWGVDTLNSTPNTINAYVRGVLGKKGDDWYYILDEDGDGTLKKEKPVKLSGTSNKLNSDKVHEIQFERYQDGKIQRDSTRIKVLFARKVNGEFRRLYFQYLESRKGAFTFNNEQYDIILNADFNSFRYDDRTRISIIHRDSGKTYGEFNEGAYIALDHDTLYVEKVKKDGSLIYLKKKGSQSESYSIQKGFMAPLFSGVTLDQDSVHLRDFKGSYTLIYFWNSTCGASTMRLEQTFKPLIEKINASEKRLNVLGVALDFPQYVESYIKEKEIDWTQIVASADGEIRDLYKVVHYPTVFLIDPNGVVVENSLEMVDNDEKTILSYFNGE